MAEIRWVKRGEMPNQTQPDMTPRLRSRDVLVLGAGFSKALTPEAPVMNDFLHLAAKRKTYDPKGRHAELAAVVRQYFGCDEGLRANIEELATFLVSRANEIPLQSQRELAYRQLLDVVKYTLAPLWDEVRSGDLVVSAGNLANACVENNVPIISFNYDLLFDNLLHQTGKWNEFRGYGSPLNATVDAEITRMGLPPIAAMLAQKPVNTVLLKLHGSLNWGTRTVPHPDGTQPVEVNAMSALRGLIPDDVPIAESALEASHILPVGGSVMAAGAPGNPNYFFEPLIIPPLANKSDWYSHPFIQNVWYHAYWALAGARRIFVVGYSLPPSDFETINLFREALGSTFDIETKPVILLINPDDDVISRFKSLFAGSQILVDRVYSDCAEWLMSEYGAEERDMP